MQCIKHLSFTHPHCIAIKHCSTGTGTGTGTDTDTGTGTGTGRHRHTFLSSSQQHHATVPCHTHRHGSRYQSYKRPWHHSIISYHHTTLWQLRHHCAYSHRHTLTLTTLATVVPCHRSPLTYTDTYTRHKRNQASCHHTSQHTTACNHVLTGMHSTLTHCCSSTMPPQHTSSHHTNTDTDTRQKSIQASFYPTSHHHAATNMHSQPSHVATVALCHRSTLPHIQTRTHIPGTNAIRHHIITHSHI